MLVFEFQWSNVLQLGRCSRIFENSWTWVGYLISSSSDFMEVLERAMAILSSEVIKDDSWASRCNMVQYWVTKQWQGVSEFKLWMWTPACENPMLISMRSMTPWSLQGRWVLQVLLCVVVSQGQVPISDLFESEGSKGSTNSSGWSLVQPDNLATVGTGA